EDEPTALPFFGQQSSLLDDSGTILTCEKFLDMVMPETAPMPPSPQAADSGSSATARIEAVERLILPEDAWRGPLPLYREYVSGLEGSYAYDLFSALTATGIALGRNVFVRYAGRSIFPNLYVVLWGPTARP